MEKNKTSTTQDITPTIKELKKFARNFSRADWDFITDIDDFNAVVLDDLKAAEREAREILLLRALVIEE